MMLETYVSKNLAIAKQCIDDGKKTLSNMEKEYKNVVVEFNLAEQYDKESKEYLVASQHVVDLCHWWTPNSRNS